MHPKTTIKMIGVSLIWLVLFGLTVNLGLSHDLLSLYMDEKGVIVGGVLLNSVGLAVLAFSHRQWTKSLIAVRQRKTYLLYLILLLAAGSVLLHYHWTGLPAVYYLLFTTVSVVWQDYLTFGFLQNYLRQLFSFKQVLILWAVPMKSSCKPLRVKRLRSVFSAMC
ncbi:hypothetical protein ACVR0O_02140 [Streptococcus caviae]|uniref:hypothetical protein n=1 Tax=Streptococcus sp. 'caviae' TaxID=1915004 RepID=UPI0015D66F12|nr:hypothetical protein [Streptococcus sp. 'caviae']